MGTYATTTSLQTLMPDITFNTATTSLATKCITWAEDEINKQLTKRYDVSSWNTSTSVPPTITTICEWLSQGYLHDQMSRGGTEAQSRADRLIERGMTNLAEIRDGIADLVDSGGSLVAESASKIYVISNTDTYHRTFDEDSPLNWKIDSDKKDDISDGRE